MLEEEQNNHQDNKENSQTGENEFQQNEHEQNEIEQNDSQLKNESSVLQNNVESEEEKLIREREERIQKLAQNRPLPEKKDDVIQYLFERLQQAETAIFDLHQVIQQEAKQKKEILNELNEKTNRLNELLDEEKTTIKDVKIIITEIEYNLNQKLIQKVQKELKVTLDFAVQQKVLVEEQKGNIQIELDSQIKLNQDLQNQINELNRQIQASNVEISDLQTQNQQQQETIESLQSEKQNQTETFQNKKIKELEDELNEAKQLITKLSDVRNALNKFNMKGDNSLKDQQIQNSKQQLQNQDNYGKYIQQTPSQAYQEDNKPPQYNNKQQDEDQDDFWYMDSRQNISPHIQRSSKK